MLQSVVQLGGGMTSRIAILGGAGFIGTNLTSFLRQTADEIIVVDNGSNSSPHFDAKFANFSNVNLKNVDVANLQRLTDSIQGCDTVVHLASNADIAAAAINPVIDFENGTYLTSNSLEAARRAGVRRFIYASGSGVYGDTIGPHSESDVSLAPVSTYGASKIAGEALVAAYAFRFNIISRVFRFANVVGPLQTHGVSYDFIRKLRNNSSELNVLGNGTQDKSYVWVDDVNAALKHAIYDSSDALFDVFNVSSDDTITVREISEIVINQMFTGKAKPNVTFASTNEGWPGDVPYIRLNNSKLKSLGWKPTRTSKQSIEDSVASMLLQN